MQLFLAAIDPDFLVFLIFLLMPLLGRVLRGVGGEEKGPEAKPGPGRRGAEPTPDAEAGEVSELERRGREAWKRLLEGLDPETKQPEVVHVPDEEPEAVEPPPPKRKPKKKVGRIERAPLDKGDLPSQSPKPKKKSKPPEPEALPSAVATAAVGDEAESYGFASPSTVDFAETAPAPATKSPRVQRSKVPGRSDLRRAVIWSEILRPPIALRRPGESDTPF